MPEEGSSAAGAERPDDEDESTVVGELVGDTPEPPAGDFLAGEVIQTISYRQSPYPTPEELAKYEEIHPGFTDRILRLTEKETDHRIQREDRQDDATIALAQRGQIFAFVVVMTLVLGGVAAILTGHSIVGFAGLVIAAATLAGSFIAPRIFSQQQLPLPKPGTQIEPREGAGRASEDEAT